MPQIGELAPGVWLAAGFGGHGLNTTAMAGELIARAIVDNDQDWRLFLPFELVWAGGALGRVAVQGMLVGGRLGRAAEKLARAFVRRPALPATDAAVPLGPAAEVPAEDPATGPKRRKARGEGKRVRRAAQTHDEPPLQDDDRSEASAPPPA
jgi:hypothetical protein